MIIGIDPGLDGGIVILDKKGFILESLPTPTIEVETSTKHTKGKNKGTNKTQKRIDGLALFKILNQYRDFKIYCEKAAPIFGVSTHTNFRMGHGAGVIEGVAMALGIEWVEVRSVTWQKAIWIESDKVQRVNPRNALKQTKTDTKATTLNAFNRLNSTIHPYIGKSKKPHDGIVDAYLIALYGLGLQK